MITETPFRLERDPRLATDQITPELIDYVQKIVARFDPYQKSILPLSSVPRRKGAL